MVSKIVVVIDENELMKVLITDLSDQPADSVPSVWLGVERANTCRSARRRSTAATSRRGLQIRLASDHALFHPRCNG